MRSKYNVKQPEYSTREALSGFYIKGRIAMTNLKLEGEIIFFGTMDFDVIKNLKFRLQIFYLTGTFFCIE